MQPVANYPVGTTQWHGITYTIYLRDGTEKKFFGTVICFPSPDKTIYILDNRGKQKDEVFVRVSVPRDGCIWGEIPIEGKLSPKKKLPRGIAKAA